MDLLGAKKMLSPFLTLALAQSYLALNRMGMETTIAIPLCLATCVYVLRPEFECSCTDDAPRISGLAYNCLARLDAVIYIALLYSP